MKYSLNGREMKPDYKSLVDQIRAWLLAGATIKARLEPGIKTLEPLEDGSWEGGLIITFPEREDK